MSDTRQPTNAQLMEELKHTRIALAHLASAVGSDIGRGVDVSNSKFRSAVSKFQTSPNTQYKIHLYGSYYWLLNFPFIAVMYFFFPHQWLAIGLLINTLYSLYANFATDYGGMSAALAAGGPSTRKEP